MHRVLPCRQEAGTRLAQPAAAAWGKACPVEGGVSQRRSAGGPAALHSPAHAKRYGKRRGKTAASQTGALRRLEPEGGRRGTSAPDHHRRRQSRRRSAAAPSARASSSGGSCHSHHTGAVLGGALVLPRPPAHGALLLRTGCQPLLNALQMERVAARAPHDGAVIAGVLALGRAAVKGRAADAAHVVACVPRPGRDRMPLLDLHGEGHRRRVVPPRGWGGGQGRTLLRLVAAAAGEPVRDAGVASGCSEQQVGSRPPLLMYLYLRVWLWLCEVDAGGPLVGLHGDQRCARFGCVKAAVHVYMLVCRRHGGARGTAMHHFKWPLPAWCMQAHTCSLPHMPHMATGTGHMVIGAAPTPAVGCWWRTGVGCAMGGGGGGEETKPARTAPAWGGANARRSCITGCLLFFTVIVRVRMCVCVCVCVAVCVWPCACARGDPVAGSKRAKLPRAAHPGAPLAHLMTMSCNAVPPVFSEAFQAGRQGRTARPACEMCVPQSAVEPDCAARRLAQRLAWGASHAAACRLSKGKSLAGAGYTSRPCCTAWQGHRRTGQGHAACKVCRRARFHHDSCSSCNSCLSHHLLDTLQLPKEDAVHHGLDIFVVEEES